MLRHLDNILPEVLKRTYWLCGIFHRSLLLLLLFICPVCTTHCDPMDCRLPVFTVLHHLLELTQIHVHWVSDAIQPSHPLLPTSPALNFFPGIRVFSSDSTLNIRWPKYWSFGFITSPSNEYSGLISFRIDWFDFLAVQGTLKSLLQHHSSKASILQCSAFFMAKGDPQKLYNLKTIVRKHQKNWEEF